MKAITLLASGPSEDGLSFGTQREEKFFEKAKGLDEDTLILFVREVIGFSPPGLYSELVVSGLLDAGLPAKNIVVLPVFCDATVRELDAAEAYLKEYLEIKKVCAASSWYHLPRIWLMWLFRHRRFVRFCPIWATESAVFVEPLKYPLLFLPPSWQGKLGKLWVRTFHKGR